MEKLRGLCIHIEQYALDNWVVVHQIFMVIFLVSAPSCVTVTLGEVDGGYQL